MTQEVHAINTDMINQAIPAVHSLVQWNRSVQGIITYLVIGLLLVFCVYEDLPMTCWNALLVLCFVQ